MGKRKIEWVILSLFVVAGVLVGLKYGLSEETYTIVLETSSQTTEVEVTPQTEETIALQGPLGKTIVEIKGGKVWVSSSPCSDGTCMKMGKIPDNGGFIACLPNQVLIRKKGAKIFPILQQ